MWQYSKPSRECHPSIHSIPPIKHATASAWMFPWERRQMEGSGGLKTWEKLYWGVFVVAISVFLFNRAREWNVDEKDSKIDEEREAKKLEKARLVLLGANMLEEEEDPFDGLSPQVLFLFLNHWSSTPILVALLIGRV